MLHELVGCLADRGGSGGADLGSEPGDIGCVQPHLAECPVGGKVGDHLAPSGLEPVGSLAVADRAQGARFEPQAGRLQGRQGCGPGNGLIPSSDQPVAGQRNERGGDEDLESGSDDKHGHKSVICRRQLLGERPYAALDGPGPHHGAEGDQAVQAANTAAEPVGSMKAEASPTSAKLPPHLEPTV